MIASIAMAQSAMNAYTMSENQLRGTARYVSMGGAFGALGGDISTLTQNPAGIGVYRRSEFVGTVDFDKYSSTLLSPSRATESDWNTTFNMGYVGVINTNNNVMPNVNWGLSYGNVKSFNRFYHGYFPVIGTSWTNSIAPSANGYTPSQLLGTDTYDPFLHSNIPWATILAYNSLLINPGPNGDYVGLYQQGSQADAEVEVQEQGAIDQVSLNLGGNVLNTLYWGVGVGLYTVDWTQHSYYNEQISNALVPNADDSGLTTGAAEWGIKNDQGVTGTGLDLKLGVIVRPINELRFGLAVHTPVFYDLNYWGIADTDFGLGRIEADGWYTHDSKDPNQKYPYNYTPDIADSDFDRNLKTPWKFSLSAAGVLGGRYIISGEYIRTQYSSMQYKADGDELTDISEDIQQYYRGGNELRLGTEVRITPAFSLRAGYNFKDSGVKQAAYDNQDYVYTTGTQSIYEFKGNQNNYTCGLGYRTSGGFYFDAAYVYTTQTNSWSAFSPFPRKPDQVYALEANAVHGPEAQLKDTNSRLIFTLGYKF